MQEVGVVWMCRVATNTNPYQGLKPKSRHIEGDAVDFSVATNTNPYQGLKLFCMLLILLNQMLQLTLIPIRD